MFALNQSLAELEDHELLALAREGNDAALEILLDRYRGYARSKAKTYFLPGADREDVVQEGMIGLFKAIRDYDTTKGPFNCFADLCVTRQIHTAVKNANRRKHTSLSAAVSIEVVSYSDLDEKGSVAETLADTELEHEVLHLYIAGRSYREIAERLGSSLKSIDNALQRVKMKFDRHFKTDRIVRGLSGGGRGPERSPRLPT